VREDTLKNLFSGKSDAESANLALQLFFAVRRSERTTYEDKLALSATRGVLENGAVSYQWGGTGPRVLIMHGWNGRATQLSGFVEPLVEHGYTVLSIDAPGHGEADGARSNGIKFAQSILSLTEKVGPFESVIAHSLGATATLVAIRRGLKIKRAVLIAPASLQEALRIFSEATGLSEKATALFVELAFAETRVHPDEAALSSMVPSPDVNLLIVHDREDAEVPYSVSEDLAANCPHSVLKTTTGLGHRRILRSSEIIQDALAFVLA
jgi:pimeloyl-ACP methyl ester carboxylesterase